MATLTFAFDRLEAATATAVTRALNRSIASARTAMVGVIAPDMGLRSGTVRDKIRIEEATQGTPVARLYASIKRIPVAEFDARGPYPSRGKGQGVSAKLSGSRTRYPNAFLADMKSGHRGVFMRKGKARLPIRELFGPSLAHVFTKHVAVGLARGQEQLTKNLASEIRFALSETA